MKIALRSGLPAAAFLAAAALSPAAQAGESKGRPWTLEDILTVPEVNEIALSDNGRLAIYAAEIADVGAGKPRSHIRIVDVATGRTKEVLTVDMIKSLRPVPGTTDWSALLDLGEGQHLYRIDTEGKLQPLIINPKPVPVGKADMSFPIGGGIRPSHIGILDYDWSPDGKWLWYSQLRAEPDEPRVRFDEEVTALLGRRRSTINVEVDYFLRGPAGSTTRIMTRPSNDRVATRGGGRILWRGDEIQFRIETGDGSLGGAFEFLAWNRVNKTVRTLAKQRDLLSMSILAGPRGGQLSTRGVGSERELIETPAEGRPYNYGRVAFDVGDSRSAGWKSSRDGRRVVIGTRGLENARYGLAVVDKKRVRELRADASLTRCGFDAMLRTAICLEEPAGYATARSSYDAVYGGAPLGDNIERWRRFAPSLNADKVCAAVLQQVASASPSQIELFEAWRAAGVATQISYYPGATAASDETHVFYLTSNRLRAMRENIAWFDYWLLGKRDADAPFPDQMVNWDRLKESRPDRCAPEP